MGLFSDSVTFPNGRVMYVPADARYASIFTPTTGELSPLVDADFGTEPGKFSRGLLLFDARIVFVPDRINSLFVYNEGLVETETGSARYFANTGDTDDVKVISTTAFQTGYEFTPPSWATHADILVVGGGGAGASTGRDTGGGGGGGLILRPDFVLSETSYNVQVGRGGERGESGVDSFFGNLVALGGGVGSPTDRDGIPGGSGGGAGRFGGDGGMGLQPGQTGESGQFGHGNPGGDNSGAGSDGAGGGGASEPGSSITTVGGKNSGTVVKRGGDGMGESVIAIFGTEFGDDGWFSGGGGGGGARGSGTFAETRGGKGGGGRGGHQQGWGRNGANGMRHTGGGGGGSDNRTGGNGGSGIVLVKLKNSNGSQSEIIAFHHGITIAFEEINVRPPGFASHERLYSDALMLPDGRVLLIPYDIGYLGVWNPFVDPEDAFTLFEHDRMESTNLCGQLLPDGTVILASRDPGQSLYRWNPRDPNTIERGPQWNVGIKNMILDERGVLIAITSGESPMLLEWSLQTGPIDPAFVRFVS